MEGIPLMPKRPEIKSIEKEANFEGNATLLLLTRLANPIIREQLVGLFLKEDALAIEKGSVTVILNSDGSIPHNEKGEMITSPTVPRTKEEIINTLDQRIETVSSSTKISFEDKIPNHDIFHLNWCTPSGLKLNVKQKSIVEAHEKGHVLRNFGNILRDHFSEGFDWSQAVFPEEDYLYYKKDNPESDREQFVKDILSYLSSPMEVVERMSQLKNYFGMSREETFTKEHLDYAREHYLKDVGFDNHMATLFSAITPEKEAGFLRLINSSGI